jgi:hypothetical protein
MIILIVKKNNPKLKKLQRFSLNLAQHDFQFISVYISQLSFANRFVLSAPADVFTNSNFML